MAAKLIDLLKDRQSQTYEGECHLSNEEAGEIIAALAAAPAVEAGPVAWKKVPKEATKELLADASSKQAGDKQVLCYEAGSYYNAWLVFDEYEGGWIWMNEADSEPNPSHYTALPAAPKETP